jgi:transcriptional regulator with XRE-family HTH domain
VENLRQYLLRRMGEEGIKSGHELADRCGLPKSTIRRLLREQTAGPPSDSTLERLARGLGDPISLVRRAAAASAGYLFAADDDSLAPDDGREIPIQRLVEQLRETPLETVLLVSAVANDIVHFAKQGGKEAQPIAAADQLGRQRRRRRAAG